MVSIKVEKIPECDEVQATISFDDDNTGAKTFMEALKLSFTEEKREQYLKQGEVSALIDFKSLEANKFSIRGLPKHLNDHFHEPYIIAPKEEEAKKAFWAVGDKIYKIAVEPTRNTAKQIHVNKAALAVDVEVNRKKRLFKKAAAQFIAIYNEDKTQFLEIQKGVYFKSGSGKLFDLSDKDLSKALLEHPDCSEELKKEIQSSRVKT